MKFLKKSVGCVCTLPPKGFVSFTRKEARVVCVCRPDHQPKPPMSVTTLSKHSHQGTGCCTLSKWRGLEVNITDPAGMATGQGPTRERLQDWDEGGIDCKRQEDSEPSDANVLQWSGVHSPLPLPGLQKGSKGVSSLIPLEYSLAPQLLCCRSCFCLFVCLYVFFTFLTNKQRSDQPRVEVLYQIFVRVVDVCETWRVVVCGPAVLTDNPLVGVLSAWGNGIIHLLCRGCVVSVGSTWRSKSYQNIRTDCEGCLVITFKSRGM